MLIYIMIFYMEISCNNNITIYIVDIFVQTLTTTKTTITLTGTTVRCIML